MSYLPGKFVWFEHVSNEPAKARAFYQSLIGWSVQDVPMGGQPYAMIMNGSDSIGGFRTAAPGMASHWLSYLSVPDVDKSHAVAVAAGAKSEMDPMAAGPGRASVITDPTGAMVSLWKGADGDPADVEKTPVGGWFWNELWSTDAKAALDFYKKVLGYGVDTLDMGEQGTYYLLKTPDGKMRAGLMQAMPDMQMPSNWLPYIHVKDCDAAAAQATQLGAKMIAVPPTDIPNVGRFSVVVDPTGAAVAVMKGIDS